MIDLDIERLRGFGFEPTQLKGLMSQFIAALLSDFESLEVKIHEKNWQQAQALAHAYKGMLSVFASAHLIQALQALEMELKSLNQNAQTTLEFDLAGLKVRLKELHLSAVNYLAQI
jgi:HPt (histidine-containing phosphotransfer) domain-containing protein